MELKSSTLRRTKPIRRRTTTPGISPSSSTEHVDAVRVLSNLDDEHVFDIWTSQEETFVRKSSKLRLKSTPHREERKHTNSDTTVGAASITLIISTPPLSNVIIKTSSLSSSPKSHEIPFVDSLESSLLSSPRVSNPASASPFASLKWQRMAYESPKRRLTFENSHSNSDNSDASFHSDYTVTDWHPTRFRTTSSNSLASFVVEVKSLKDSFWTLKNKKKEEEEKGEERRVEFQPVESGQAKEGQYDRIESEGSNQSRNTVLIHDLFESSNLQYQRVEKQPKTMGATFLNLFKGKFARKIEVPAMKENGPVQAATSASHSCVNFIIKRDLVETAEFAWTT